MAVRVAAVVSAVAVAPTAAVEALTVAVEVDRTAAVVPVPTAAITDN